MIRFSVTAALLAMFCSQALTGHEQTWREADFQHSKEVYMAACASCHDEGDEVTPAIGDRDAWSDRSPLWSAVLLEHAKSGYLEMPPKGDQQELSDRDVEVAGEYMLLVTFPDMPRD